MTIADDIEAIGKVRADSRYHVDVHWDVGFMRVSIQAVRGTHAFPETGQQRYVYPPNRLESLFGKTLESKVHKSVVKMQRTCDELNAHIDADRAMKIDWENNNDNKTTT